MRPLTRGSRLPQHEEAALRATSPIQICRDPGEFGHGSFALVHWNGSAEVEEQIKNDLKVTIRCIPFGDVRTRHMHHHRRAKCQARNLRQELPGRSHDEGSNWPSVDKEKRAAVRKPPLA